MASVRLPDRKVMQACFDIFFERHLSNTFCGFVYCPDLENYPAEAPFLSTAITCLCARYLSGAQAKEYFGLQTGEEASHLYTPIARSLARATLDEPSGKLTLDLVSPTPFVATNTIQYKTYRGISSCLYQSSSIMKDLVTGCTPVPPLEWLKS